MSTPEAQLVYCLRQRREYNSTDGVRWYQVAEPDGDCQRAADAIERLTAALDEARAERSVAYLAFEQLTAERDSLRAALAQGKEPSNG